MELESTQSNTTAKLPILKLKNCNSWVSVLQTTQENGTSVTKMSVPVTAEEKTNKKNDVKARILLLIAPPNEHQLTFSKYTDAKTMFAAIKTRFGGNEATKKTQKTLLKKQYENFSASSAESLDSIFNRLHKIVSRLAILGVVIAQEDLNLKILNSLPPEWNTHVVVWMNKAEIETMSIDDLYNNFKIVEQSIKKYVGASSVSTVNPNVNTASPQVSTASFSDNDVYAFMVENPNGSNLLQQDLEQIHEDDLEAIDLKWQLSLLSMRAKRYYQRTGKKIFINANDTDGYDKSNVECFNCHKMGHFARECRASRNKEGQFRNQDNTRKQGNNEDTSSKAMLAIDGVGFDWSDMVEEQVQTNMALMAFSDSELNQTEFTAATYKRGLATVEELITYRKNEVLFSEEVAVLKREVACKDYKINVLKSEFEKVKQDKESIEFKINKFDKASKDLDKLLGSQIIDKSKRILGYNDVPPPHPLIYNRPKKLDLSYSGLDEFKEPEFKAYGSEDSNQKSNVVLDLEKAKDAQAKEIAGLKKRGRIKIVDETHGRLDDAEMFDTDDHHGDEVIVDTAVGEKQEKSAKIDEREVDTDVEDSAAPTIPVTTVDEGVTTAKIDEITPTSATTIVIDELTFVQTLIEIKQKDQVALDEEMARNLEAQLRYDEIQKLFDKEMKRVNSFVAMNSEDQEISRKKDESSSKKTEIAQDSSAKRVGDKLESDESKKQKTDENEEVEEDNEAELKKHLVIVKDNDIAIDAIPLATKPPVIIKYKLIKEGIVGHYQLIRADGSSKRYYSMIRMLQGIDREDLKTHGRLVKQSRNLQIHMMNNKFRGGLLGLKDFKMILRGTAAQDHGNNEDTSSKAMLAIDGVGFDWSDMAEEQVQTNMALMMFLDSEPEFKGYGSENSKQESNIVCDQKSDDSKENFDDSLVKEQVESSLNVDKETVFPVDKKAHCKYHQRERVVYGNNYNRVNYNYTTKAQAVNTARPKTVKTARLNSAVVNAVRVNQENDVKASACWVWRRTKPDSASITLKKHNYIDARGRSKCSRHMIGNIAYLLDFKEFDGGYVTFRGGAHGGRISGKGTLKTDILNFKDVYFVNELKFNIFSVSQMYDKKNYVLFTDTECLVLSPNFKLLDESHILLKIPRKDNIYSFDMKNIVPKESLTCLVAKATLDESML
ncbi:putative ribonuclease H-like domain-containing protein [Tanacetum coccineum]